MLTVFFISALIVAICIVIDETTNYASDLLMPVAVISAIIMTISAIDLVLTLQGTQP